MDSYYMGKYNKYKNKYINTRREFVGLTGGLVEFDSVPNSVPVPRQMQSPNNQNKTNLIKAIAVFNPNPNSNPTNQITGSVLFEEVDLDSSIKVKVTVNLSGFVPNTTHGFHVHETGDLSRGCDSLCAHFNPYGKTHGGREDEERHVGDLGNIQADSNGRVSIEFTDHLIKLRGNDANIIGRGLIVHAGPDDCGKGHVPESKTTGNSGSRIACAIIGYASTCENKK